MNPVRINDIKPLTTNEIHSLRRDAVNMVAKERVFKDSELVMPKQSFESIFYDKTGKKVEMLGNFNTFNRRVK